MATQEDVENLLTEELIDDYISKNKKDLEDMVSCQGFWFSTGLSSCVAKLSLQISVPLDPVFKPASHHYRLFR